MEKDTRRFALVSVILGICAVTLIPIHAGLLERLNGLQMRFSPAPFLQGSRAIFLFDFVQNILQRLFVRVADKIVAGRFGNTKQEARRRQDYGG